MRGQRDEGSFALVSTLLIVAVMALGALAFFQTARMDRLVTRNTADRVRAELAAESGLAMAAAQLQSILTNDTFVITLSATTNPLSSNQLYAGHWQTGAAAGMSYRPLFSAQPTATNLTGLRVNTSAQPEITNIPWSANSATSPTVRFTNWSLPGGLRMTSPALYWMAITNTNGVTTARFAFWVEDLAGRLDLSVAGSIGTNAARPTGTNPAELALWSLFNPGASNDLSNAVVAALLTNARSGVLTAASARLASASVSTNLMADLAARLVHDTNEPELIPFGFNYTNQGQPKLNLNQVIANPPADAINLIVSQISNNLTNFIERAGGFTNSSSGGATNTNAYTGMAYLQTLAANIIDYVDQDSDPTTDGTPLSANRIRPVYRGVDSYPFVNEINKRYQLISTNLATEAGVNGRMAVVATTDFIELWNPSSQTVPPGTLTLVIAHRQPITFGLLNATFSNPTRASNSLGEVIGGLTTNIFPGVTIPPNGFLTLSAPTVTNYFFSPITNPANFQTLDERTNSHFWVSWNGRYFDAALGGMSRNAGSLTVGTAANRSQMPAFIYRTLGGFADPAVGDPRSTIYLSRILDANAYAPNSTFGGRNRRSGTVAPGQPFYEVAPATWPDGGHNSLPGNPAGSDNALPTAVTAATYSNVPPGRISNAGSYSNLFELGAIFDPMQWRDPGLGAWQGKYTNLSTAGVADNGYGGGNTLRVGRAEHPRFTNNGLQAAQLLDLFAVSTNAADTIVTNRVAGKINLNTATTNALRALAAGVVHTRDPALSPGGTNFTVPTTTVGNFIAGVTNFRSTRPFLSSSQLPLITNGTTTYPSNAVFGTSNSLNVTAWNDAAAEEWFSKVYPLATVRSRNFLVHVVGQAMSTNTNSAARPLASSRKLFQVYAAPIRNAAGLTTNVTVQVVQSWNLQ